MPKAKRPRFKPTDQVRAMVKAMAAYGVPQYDISLVAGCSVPTLRKHFFRELESAGIEANAKVAQGLFKVATEGAGKEAITAMIFWLKCRAGWRDNPFGGGEPGKKENEKSAAATAGRGTEWGDDLQGPPSRLH